MRSPYDKGGDNKSRRKSRLKLLPVNEPLRTRPNHGSQSSFFLPCHVGHNVSELAHDCLATLENWFEERSIKNSYDTRHGKCIEEGKIYIVSY